MNIFDRFYQRLTKHDIRRGWMVVSEREWNEYIQSLDGFNRILMETDNIPGWVNKHSRSCTVRLGQPYYRGCQLRVL